MEERNDLNENVDYFIEYMRNVKNASENTVSSYRRDLSAMAKYFIDQSIYTVDRINATNINSYILHMEKIGRSTATIARNISAIKTFFRYMINNSQIKREPTDNLHIPQSDKKRTDAITSDDMTKILNQVSGNGHMELRDRAMLKLMMDTGIKVSELTELKVSDVNFQLAYVTCHGKKKDKTIRFSEDTLTALKNYLDDGRTLFIKAHNDECMDILFYNRFGRKLSRQGFWKIFKVYATMAGVADISTHAIYKK